MYPLRIPHANHISLLLGGKLVLVRGGLDKRCACFWEKRGVVLGEK